MRSISTCWNRNSFYIHSFPSTFHLFHLGRPNYLSCYSQRLQFVLSAMNLHNTNRDALKESKSNPASSSNNSGTTASESDAIPQVVMGPPGLPRSSSSSNSIPQSMVTAAPNIPVISSNSSAIPKVTVASAPDQEEI